VARLRGEQDHRHVGERRLGAHAAAQLVAVEARHDEVGDDEVGPERHHVGQRLLRAPGLQELVARPEHGLDDASVGRRVVDEKDAWLGVPVHRPASVYRRGGQAGVTSAQQNLQRLAALAIGSRHIGHSRVFGGGGGGAASILAIAVLIPFTMRKRTNAMMTSLMSTDRICPTLKLSGVTVHASHPVCGVTAPTMGMTMSSTAALTTSPNSAPMTTATARSMTLPLSANSLNSFHSAMTRPMRSP